MSFDSIIVTACDSGYAALALDLLTSIRDKPELSRHRIGLLDLGLTSEERERFAACDVDVRQVGWDLDFPGRSNWQENLPGYKAMVSRSFLREHFPGYTVCLWMDADTWVQRPDAISAIINAGRDGELIIATELDRQFFQYFKGPPIWQVFRHWYVESFGDEVANRMNLRPMLNTGVFALSATAPHWEIWREIYVEGLRRNAAVSAAGFMMEQLAMNVAVYLRNLHVRILPARYNWLCHHAMPAWEVRTGMFVEPELPHEAISIMHLSQKNKMGEFDVAQHDPAKAPRRMSLRYPGSSKS